MATRLREGDRRGAWEAVELLGTGGVGEVWRCTGPDGQDGALKVLLANTREVDQVRFQREMKALDHLDHPAIVGLLDSGIDNDGKPWLVMQYVPGETLEAWVTRAGAIPQDVAVPWFAELAHGLAHCHESGIHHRDIKASNVIVRPDGGLTLVDFGAAISQTDNRVTQQGAVLGTASYMPPEVCHGEERDAVLCDVYALGQLLCEALEGRLLFRAEPGTKGLKQLRSILSAKVDTGPLDPGEAFPEWLRTAVQRATEPNPRERLDSSLQLAILLQRASTGESIRTPLLAMRRDPAEVSTTYDLASDEGGPLPRTTRTPQQVLATWAGLATLALIAVGALVWMLAT